MIFCLHWPSFWIRRTQIYWKRYFRLLATCLSFCRNPSLKIWRACLGIEFTFFFFSSLPFANELVSHCSLNSSYTRLLAHHRSYVRQFAAESFAFLLRKVPATSLGKYIGFLATQATCDSAIHLRHGISCLLFETAKVGAILLVGS